MKPTNTQIADLLAGYRRAKAVTKELRVQLIRLAVDEFGADQSEAHETRIETFFDGYLVGQGMMQSFRVQP